MPTKTEAITNMLKLLTHTDLSSKYSLKMECQVNVAADGGDRIDGEYMGRRWQGWTDGLSTWKSFRIPYKAATEPEYEDKEIKFDLATHAEGIGMTGWNWYDKVSEWVAFDFDSITNHKVGLNHDQLEEVKKAAMNIPWVTVRRSTSGKGLHLYVMLDNVSTATHTEHAALARSILSLMSALSGHDLREKVDSCGGNMWVWHRKMDKDKGLELIKQGETLTDIPINWKAHIPVVSGISSRTFLPSKFEELVGQRPIVNLDTDHIKLISYLKDIKAVWWWDQDHSMLVTHTWFLKEAYEELKFKGYFDTISTGKDKGTDHNCFLFPLRNGSWVVRRFTPGVQEHESWIQDSNGWTKCYLNTNPSLQSACLSFGGIEDPKGGYVFTEASLAIKAAELLGILLELPAPMLGRKTTIRQHKDNRIIIEVERTPHDMPLEGWLTKGQNIWTRIFNSIAHSTDLEPQQDYDYLVRHICTEDEDNGWVIFSEGIWHNEPLLHIRIALKSIGFSIRQVEEILGAAIFKPWKLVNRPFKPEYPGNREWNRASAQLKFPPSLEIQNLSYPTWMSILNHCGKGLEDTIKENSWCVENGIVTGGEYLKCWVASMFQYPTRPLPYLFFYGPQNSGKSTFFDSLSLLLTKGYCRADTALKGSSEFNGELEGAILCAIEETDLSRDKAAYNKMKDWVTAVHLPIHHKRCTPYHVINTTHWVQTANSLTECPILPGDTRITVSYVPSIDPKSLMQRDELYAKLIKEAPDFLSAVMYLELPIPKGRLGIEVLRTQEKELIEQINKTSLEVFIEEETEPALGYAIKFSEFYDQFCLWQDSAEPVVSKIKVGKDLSAVYPKGRMTKDGQMYIGNIKWKNKTNTSPEKGRLVLKNGYLEYMHIGENSND